MTTTTELQGMIADAALPTAHRLVEAGRTYDLDHACHDAELEVEGASWTIRVAYFADREVVQIRARPQGLPEDGLEGLPPFFQRRLREGTDNGEIAYTIPVAWLPSADPRKL